jgi:hypothetical protein
MWVERKMLLMIKISSPKYISGGWLFIIALIISSPGYIQDAIRDSFKKESPNTMQSGQAHTNEQSKIHLLSLQPKSSRIEDICCRNLSPQTEKKRKQ